MFNIYENSKKVNKTEEVQLDRILHEGLEQLDHTLGAGWKVTLCPHERIFGGDQIIIYHGQREIYRAEYLAYTQFKDEHIARNFTQLKHHKTIVVAEYILPKTKELLRKEGIDYLDINGNCYIRDAKGTDIFFLHIDGQKNQEYHKEKFNRPFAKAGLKVTYQFLINPNLVNQTYREIAEKAGVALGNIKPILNGLMEEGFMLRKNKNEYKLIKIGELLDKWGNAYGEKLKPTLELGTFRFLNPNEFNTWKEIDLNDDKTSWGGEAAANLYTDYLKPGILTIYTQETKNELIRKYKLVPDHNGNIKIYSKFWQNNDREDKTTPILTYVDLILTKDMRCLETAHMIYEQYIEKNV
jgi:hypothetical protein